MNVPFRSLCIRCYGGPVVVACLSLVAVLSAIDPGGSYPNAPQGPGLTSDETFNVQMGVILSSSIRSYGLAVLHPRSLQEMFDFEGYNPDHPPFGRLWIGLFHNATLALFPPDDPQLPFVTACARTAPAFAFALLVLLIGVVAQKWYGPAAGIVAALSVVLMPRVFGHAHLASLETFIALMYTASALAVAHFWSGPSAPSARCSALTGVIFGLTLLTKIQAILLPIPVACWALYHWRCRGILPVLIWGITGCIVFYLGWPWLWSDPLEHLAEYFGRTADRVALYTWYFGERFADREVPWHYPFVMFLTTVPVGLHLLAFTGLLSDEHRVWRGQREQVLLGCVLFPLLLFAAPGVTVYDGTRLFLVVFPLWAVFAGRGAVAVLTWLQQRFSQRAATGLLATLLVFQAYGLAVVHPCYLSYYNLLVGGLAGAEKLGLETTYWGDSVTREFLKQTVAAVPRGSAIIVSPPLQQ